MRPVWTFHRGTIAALALGAALLAGGAAAEGVDASLLAGTCANCHGTEGRSPGTIPSIAGKPFAVLDAQLAAFKAGAARDATVMTRLALGFTDEELTALARHFSEIQP